MTSETPVLLNIFDGSKDEPEGYEKLAELMTVDNCLSIFRSFKRENFRNLLYLQAEIVLVSAELDEIVLQDKKSPDDDVKKFPFSVEFLKNGYIDVPNEQWQKVRELRRLLKEYNEALVQQSHLLQFKPPHSRDLSLFKSWLHRVDCGGSFGSIPAEMDQWNGEDDLIVLKARYPNVAPMTRWAFNIIPYLGTLPYIGGYLGSLLAKRENTKSNTIYYDDDKINYLTRIASIAASAGFPAASMVVLYVVKNTAFRLAIIIIFNLVFSIILGLLAKTRRVELFAASTAFAAVQVAFITNLNG